MLSRQHLEILSLIKEIQELEAQIKWGQDHPYAGHCGEDDAAQDRLDQLREDLALLKGDS